MTVFIIKKGVDMTLERIREMLRKPSRFLVSGAIATGIDYAIYLVLVNRILPPAESNLISYSVAVLCNFTMQYYFVFTLKRKLRHAFLGSLLVSLGGLAISTGMVHYLSTFSWFNQHQFFTKLLTTGSVFVYNFFGKKIAFEGKFWK